MEIGGVLLWLSYRIESRKEKMEVLKESDRSCVSSAHSDRQISFFTLFYSFIHNNLLLVNI